MKVLVFITQFNQLGGAEKLAVELAEGLNLRGVRTDILSMYTEGLPGVAEAKKSLLHMGIPSVHFLGLNVHPSIVSLLIAIYKLRRLIRKQKYDVIETSLKIPAVSASWAVRGTRTRLISGLHQVFRKDRETTKQHKLWLFSAKFNRRIRYYAISNYAAESWVSYSKTQPQHIRRIYNAISNDYFNVVTDKSSILKELELPSDVQLAIYVGRLAACKGIDTLLDALCPVLKQQNLILLYIGRPDFYVNGTSEMLRRMEILIANENLNDKVKFLSYRNDIPRLMAAADVLVHPSRMEGFGLTLVEAMATGLPVVASNIEAIPEVLTGTGSLMVSPNDFKALREMVLTALNRSPSEVKLVVEKGRQRAQCFRMDDRTDAILKLFEDVVSNRF